MSGTPFPKTPEALRGYDLVVLVNIDLKTLTLAQRDWLRGYVRDGGRLLLLGGPYGFGRGFWQGIPTSSPRCCPSP